jgi:hypothetical protein
LAGISLSDALPLPDLLLDDLVVLQHRVRNHVEDAMCLPDFYLEDIEEGKENKEVDNDKYYDKGGGFDGGQLVDKEEEVHGLLAVGGGLDLKGRE